MRPRSASVLAALVALIGVTLLSGCDGGTSPKAPVPAGLASLPPNQIVAKALAAARAAGSLHSASTAKTGLGSAVYSDDSSARAGRQVITEPGDGGHATILVLAGVGYIRGNAVALAGFFGLPDATAVQLAGRWLSVRPGQTGYQQIVQGVTTGSLLGASAPTGRLTVTPPTRVDGYPVVGVRGQVAASAGLPPGSADILYVAATGRPLPVSVQEGTGSNEVTVVFSHWGENVRVSAPRHVTPLPTGAGPLPV